MQETTKYLCKNIQGCVFGYTQSDEITLILVDYENLNSSAWFDYEVQKLCSISASMATMIFNRLFERAYLKNFGVTFTVKDTAYIDTLRKCIEKGAMFDARCFNIPKEEVTNLVYWRQLDAARNSVQMVGRAYFSHKELENCSCSKIQDMLHEKFDINWNDFPIPCKRGTACRKTEDGWVMDYEMPKLNEDTDYVNSLIYVGEC
jgi:tRNA(His) 5'-end guanylyltransferase